MSVLFTQNDECKCCLCSRSFKEHQGNYITPVLIGFLIKDYQTRQEILAQFDFEFVCADCEEGFSDPDKLAVLLFKQKLDLF